MLKDQLKKTIEIKISTVVAISVILHAADTAVLAAALSEMTGGMPDYFDDEFAVIDVGPLGAQAGAIEWGELVGLLKRHSLNPVAVRNAPDGVEAAAAGHGLSVDVVAKPRQDARQAEPVLEHGAEAGVEAEVEAMVAQSPAVEAHAGAAQAPEVEAQATPAPKLETKAEAEATAAPKQEAKATATPPHADAAPALPTMFVDTPVRAGQRIYARGGDLVIMAAVNHGAEVVADGSIHIYGALRGRAIAGNSGNPDARIFALFMEPELVSINGLYRTFEDGFPRGAAPQPTQVRLSGEKIELLPLPPVSRI